MLCICTARGALVVLLVVVVRKQQKRGGGGGGGGGKTIEMWRYGGGIWFIHGAVLK